MFSEVPRHGSAEVVPKSRQERDEAGIPDELAFHPHDRCNSDISDLRKEKIVLEDGEYEILFRPSKKRKKTRKKWQKKDNSHLTKPNIEGSLRIKSDLCDFLDGKISIQR